MIKLCKDCIHIRPDDEVCHYARCTLRIVTLDPVYGKHIYRDCVRERCLSDGCGPAGRFFGPKSILRGWFG